jgi:hypothetical protein
MYFSYLKGPPHTPVRASWARWVEVRIHVILLGIVGYVFYGNCTVIVNIQNKCKKRTRVFDYSVVTMSSKKREQYGWQTRKNIVHSTWYSYNWSIFILSEFNRYTFMWQVITYINVLDVFVQHNFFEKKLLILKGQFFVTSKADVVRDAGD